MTLTERRWANVIMLPEFTDPFFVVYTLHRLVQRR